MREAAEALRLTAQDLHELRVTDWIVPEPVGGAHRHRETVIADVGGTIEGMLAELDGMDGDALLNDRRRKYLDMGGHGLAA
jgi:acetyl-CoA carboxylase carboxyl transferase subunit alpha